MPEIGEGSMTDPYVPPPAWQWDAWTEQERRDFMDQIDAADITPNHCTCSTWCGELSEAGCPFCVWSDIYAPCPAVGSGCGMTSLTEKTCDDEECCTPEQYARAQAGGVIDKFIREVRRLGLPSLADRLAQDCASAVQRDAGPESDTAVVREVVPDAVNLVVPR